MVNEKRSPVFKQKMASGLIAPSPDFLLCSLIIPITAGGLFVIWTEKEIKK